MRKMRNSIGLVILLIGAAGLAFAGGGAAAPEIDPVTGVAALALLSGGILVIRARGKK
jgi:hypothetical protein